MIPSDLSSSIGEVVEMRPKTQILYNVKRKIRYENKYLHIVVSSTPVSVNNSHGMRKKSNFCRSEREWLSTCLHHIKFSVSR